MRQLTNKEKTLGKAEFALKMKLESFRQKKVKSRYYARKIRNPPIAFSQF